MRAVGVGSSPNKRTRFVASSGVVVRCRSLSPVRSWWQGGGKAAEALRVAVPLLAGRGGEGEWYCGVQPLLTARPLQGGGAVFFAGLRWCSSLPLVAVVARHRRRSRRWSFSRRGRPQDRSFPPAAYRQLDLSSRQTFRLKGSCSAASSVPWLASPASSPPSDSSPTVRRLAGREILSVRGDDVQGPDRVFRQFLSSRGLHVICTSGDFNGSKKFECGAPVSVKKNTTRSSQILLADPKFGINIGGACTIKNMFR
jgi:hypothetical protein